MLEPPTPSLTIPFISLSSGVSIGPSLFQASLQLTQTCTAVKLPALSSKGSEMPTKPPGGAAMFPQSSHWRLFQLVCAITPAESAGANRHDSTFLVSILPRKLAPIDAP